MSDPKDDIELEDCTKININGNINNAFYDINNDLENKSTKNDENSLILSSSNKNFKKKQNFSNINYSINDNPITNQRNKEKEKNGLYSIEEETNEENNKKNNISKKEKNEKEDDEDYFLIEDNKKKTIDYKEDIIKILSKNKNSINIEIETKKNKKEIYPKKKDDKDKDKDLKKISKKQIDLDFLDKDEQEEENEDDFKTYIQKPFDYEREYKIIYEFNKLPYKPKILNIDLSVFDENSIFKCITESAFDKNEKKFIFTLNFVYISNKSKLYSKKNIDEIIMKYYYDYNQSSIQNTEEKNGNNSDLDENIKLKVILKRFRTIKGYDSLVARKVKIIYKKDDLDEFQKIKFDEEEDISSYKTYHKVYYILQIENLDSSPSSKKSLPVKKIGIQNEGNTCYMNSIIQSIYNNNFLLKKIMQINTDDSELFFESENSKNKDKEVILTLQNLFYKLYINKNSIKIIDIFFAFNWKRNFWNSPQDAEEIYIEIYQIISLYDEEIKNNCEGMLINTIDVKEIGYKSTREENFFFLQLDIENNDSLEKCLENFFKNEELTGDNKYQYIDNSGNQSLHNAIKFYRFKKIPNILFIQLKRFQYDINTFSFIKNNKGISFEEEINLTNYLYTNDNSTRYKSSNKKSKSKKKFINNEIYCLYCVIVHSGSSQSGHYFCFVKDFKNDCYIKFNDTRVELAEKKEVFNHNFGGEEIENVIKKVGKKKDSKEYEVKEIKKEIDKNAYLFIYINKDKINELFIDNNDTIKELFDEYKKKDDLKKKKKKEQNKNTDEEEFLRQFISNKNDNLQNTKNYKNKNIKNNYKRNTYIPQGNKNNKYYYKEYRNNNNRFDINMNENEFNFTECLSDLNNHDYSNLINNNLSKKYKINNNINNKRNTFYIYNAEGKMNNKKINEYLIIKDMITNFYLIDDISNKVKSKFFIEYNTKIKVKDVPIKIKEQINNGKIDNSLNVLFEKVVNSPGYKLAIVNGMGFFIKFLDNEEDDITHLLKNDDDKKNNKHLCLYNLKQYENIKKIIIINFISKNILDLIISKSKSLYENYNFENINVPTFIINEEIKDIKELNNRIKEIYINYFGKNAQKNNKFKIYVFKDKDILNLDIAKITFIELIEDNFFLYMEDYPDPLLKINYFNLLVGI